MSASVLAARPDHILIVDGDREGRAALAARLETGGCRASVAANGQQMLFTLEDGGVDLIVLNALLPGEDALQLCRELHAGCWRTVPLVMVSAFDDEIERILGLEMGADDVITGPVSSRELLARIRAVLRRTRMAPPDHHAPKAAIDAVQAPLLHFGDWRLDTTARHLLAADGAVVALGIAEYRLLRIFLEQPQRVLTRDQLQNLMLGRDAELFDRSIDLLVSRLRQRLSDDARAPRYIRTLRNEGYLFSASVETHGASMAFDSPAPRQLRAGI